MMNARNEVYRLVDKERNYQNSKDGHNMDWDSEISVADWILYIEHQLFLAKKEIYNMSDFRAMNCIRKVTALGIAIPFEDKVTATVTFKISGTPTMTS